VLDLLGPFTCRQIQLQLHRIGYKLGEDNCTLMSVSALSMKSGKDYTICQNLGGDLECPAHFDLF
jgi:hypothetical protein